MAGPNSNPEIMGPATLERSAVLLPCEPDQFRDFIAGLLGRPQIIGRRISEAFEVELGDIENLYHLVDQRISSQNDATLIQFTTRIVYDDESSILLNSFADFMSYKEVKPLVSTAVHLSWTYLIKFRNKSVPEKQQIDVSFNAGHPNDVTLDEFDFPRILTGIRVRRTPPGIRVRISHTDRSWGTDIDALLAGSLQTLVRHDSGLRALVRANAGWIAFLGGLALFAFSLYFGLQKYNEVRETALAPARGLIAGNVNDLDQAVIISRAVLKFVIENPMDANNGIAVLSVFGLLIASVVFAALLATFAGGEKPSFVVLTTRADELRKREMGSDRSSWIPLIASVAGALILSIAGNYLFYLILKRYLE